MHAGTVSKTLTSREILKIQNQPQEVSCVFLEVIRLFNKLMCKKPNCCFHTFQQNPKSSLWDTGLRLDGLPALELWDLIVSVLGNVFSCFRSIGQLESDVRISSWSYDMAGHAKKCVEQYCELANKTTFTTL